MLERAIAIHVRQIVGVISGLEHVRHHFFHGGRGAGAAPDFAAGLRKFSERPRVDVESESDLFAVAFHATEIAGSGEAKAPIWEPNFGALRLKVSVQRPSARPRGTTACSRTVKSTAAKQPSPHPRLEAFPRLNIVRALSKVSRALGCTRACTAGGRRFAARDDRLDLARQVRAFRSAEAELDRCSAKSRGLFANLATGKMERGSSAHDAKCAEFAPEFREDKKPKAGIAPRIIGVGRRAAAYAGAERAAQRFAVGGELKPLFERATNTAALVDHRDFDGTISAFLRAENAAISFRVLEYVADHFAQTVGKRRSHFELIALSDETRETFALLMDHAPERLAGFGCALIEFCSRQCSDRKPCCAAWHCAWRIANRDAEPLEETDVSEILVRGFAGTDTLGGDTAILALPKKRAQRSAGIQQAERFNAAERREIDRRHRRGKVSGQSGSEVERGVRIERRRQRDRLHAASYGVGVIASNPDALGPPVKKPRAA